MPNQGQWRKKFGRCDSWWLFRKWIIHVLEMGKIAQTVSFAWYMLFMGDHQFDNFEVMKSNEVKDFMLVTEALPWNVYRFYTSKHKPVQLRPLNCQTHQDWTSFENIYRFPNLALMAAIYNVSQTFHVVIMLTYPHISVMCQFPLLHNIMLHISVKWWFFVALRLEAFGFSAEDFLLLVFQ